LQHIETFIEEGLTNRDISEKLGRSEAGIRNIRYRKGLVNKAESESKILFQQRDGLKRIVWALQGQKTSLTTEVAGLKKEKEKLEASINTDKILLHGVLAKALMNLKQRRPDLFYLTGQDQLVSLVRLFLGFISE
jgi:hypothetical protein